MRKLILLAALMLLVLPVNADVYKYTGVAKVNFAADSSGYPPFMYATVFGLGNDTGTYLDASSAQFEWPAWRRDSGGTPLFDTSMVRIHLLVDSLVDTITPSGLVGINYANGFTGGAEIIFGTPHKLDVVATTCIGTGIVQESVLVYDSVADAVIEGARFFVESTSGVDETDWITTDVNGRGVAMLAATDWDVHVNSPGYFQAGGKQTITVALDYEIDTVYAYSFLVDPPSAVTKCNVVLFTDEAYAPAMFTPNSQKIQSVNGQFLSSAPIDTTADSNGTIVVTLPKSDSTRQKTTWHIEVWSRDPNRPKMLDIDEYFVPAQTQDTVWVEEQD
jgi:hypothetical protein